jgi:hypothetical protein
VWNPFFISSVGARYGGGVRSPPARWIDPVTIPSRPGLRRSPSPWPRPSAGRTWLRSRGPLEFQTEDLFLGEVRPAGGRVLTVTDHGRREDYRAALEEAAARWERNGDVTLSLEWVTDGAEDGSDEPALALRVRHHLKTLLLDHAIRDALAMDDALREEAARAAGIHPRSRPRRGSAQE